MATTRKIRNLLATSFLVAGVVLLSASAEAATNSASKAEGDTRIKTLVYNDAEVFRVIMRNGFQTDIELAQDESIDTLSIGDSIGWQVTPASHRIFIKPLQRTGVTNLSVITNKRTYQFELVATNPTNNTPDHAYVVKFYYPESENGNGTSAPIDRTRGSMRPVSQTAIPELPSATPPTLPQPEKVTPPVLPGDIAPAFAPQTTVPATDTKVVVSAEPNAMPPVPTAPTPPVMPGDMKAPPVAFTPSGDNYNFNYTLSGPEEGAPIKIYDDGRSTFFQFRSPPSPSMNFAKVMPDGSEMPLPARPDSDGKMIVDQIGSKFTIRDGSSLICVFNENASPAPATAAGR